MVPSKYPVPPSVYESVVLDAQALELPLRANELLDLQAAISATESLGMNVEFR